MLQNDRVNISSDRKQRFISNRVIESVPLASPATNIDIWKDSKASRGDFIILVKNKVIITGTIINFRYIKEKRKSKMAVYDDNIDLESGNIQKIGVLLDPYFEVEGNEKTEIKNKHEFISLKYYKYHAKEETDFSEGMNTTLISTLRNS